MPGTDIRKLCIPPYATPFFNWFIISGQASTIEVGSIITVNKVFLWSTSNSFNVQINSIDIYDVTLASLIASGLADDGTEGIVISPISNALPMSHSWRADAIDTQSTPFSSALFSITSCYYEFYGPTNVNPTTSAQIRALPNNRPDCASTSFSLITGTIEKIFVIAIPSTKTLVSVFDATAGFFITGTFTSSTFNVNDAGGTPISYNIYRLNNAVPYTTSHTFNIITT